MTSKSALLMMLGLWGTIACAPQTRHFGTGAESPYEAVDTLIHAFVIRDYFVAREVTGWDASFDCGGILLFCLDPLWQNLLKGFEKSKK